MKSILTIAASCFLLFCAMSSSMADQPKPTFDLAPAMANLAGEIHAYMKGKDQETGPVNVGSFKYVPNPNEANARDVTTQAGFQQMLRDALGSLKHPLQPDAPFSVTGTYATTEVELDGRRCLGLQVNVEITDGVGKRSKFSFSDEVVGEAAILAGLGITMSLDPNNSREQNDNDIRRQLIDPKFFQAGDTVFSSASSQFGVEVLVKGQPVEVDGKDGHATIQLRRDDAYEIRLINKAPFEVAASVSIDGISMFTFSTVRDEANNQPRYSSLIVPAAKGNQPGTVVVPGWHRSDKDRGFDQFLITEYAKSAAGKLNKTTDLGTISVLWQACWEKDQPMPQAIAQSEPGKRRGGLGDATGFGQPTGGRSQAVVRELGVVRDSVCVRYDIAK